MTTKKMQLRANQAWRERTGLQLVQAWLPKPVVHRLDRIVTDTGARGRAGVLAKLIKDASVPDPETP
ncbi:MAG: hypothetical protein ACOYB3_14475 [Azonexus sp.]